MAAEIGAGAVAALHGAIGNREIRADYYACISGVLDLTITCLCGNNARKAAQQ
jgi:hypothetical protein